MIIIFLYRIKIEKKKKLSLRNVDEISNQVDEIVKINE